MSKTEQTAKFLRRHRRQWVSAFALMKVGGQLAWRTEVSRCRRDRGMDVIWNQNPKRSAYKYVGKLKAA